MDNATITSLKKNKKISQLSGGLIWFIGMSVWKYIDASSPGSPYYEFTNSPDFNPILFFAAGSIMPAIFGVALYFIIGFTIDRAVKKQESKKPD
jgi:hypothetical protein